MARLKEQQRELAYRIYVTDSLKALLGAPERYAEFLDTKPTDTRSAKEVADDILNRAGIEVKKR